MISDTKIDLYRLAKSGLRVSARAVRVLGEPAVEMTALLSDLVAVGETLEPVEFGPDGERERDTVRCPPPEDDV